MACSISNPAITYKYQLSRLMRGKARSLAPIIRGTRKFPKHSRDRWDQKEEDHHLAVHGEELVVSVGLHQVARWGQQLQPNQKREEPSDEKEERDRQQIQKRDALVIRREQPRLDAVFLIQIVFAFCGYHCGSCHCYCTFRILVLRFRVIQVRRSGRAGSRLAQRFYVRDQLHSAVPR